MTRSRLVWALFAAAFLSSTVASSDPWLSLCGHYMTGFEIVPLLALCWLAWEMGVENPLPETLSRWMTVAGVVGAGYLVLQRLGLDPWVWSGEGAWAGPGRMRGLAGEPVYSGALVALALPWVASWWLALPIAASVALTGSRAAILAAAVVLGWRAWRDFPAKRSYMMALAALVVFMVCQIQHGPSSDVRRVEYNRVALMAFKQRPVLGWGPGTGVVWFIRCRDAATVAAMGGVRYVCFHSHNLITNVLVTQGLLGLAAWGLLLLAGWRAATSRTRAALLSMGIFAMFEPVPHSAYIVIALAAGIDLASGGAPGRGGRSNLLPAAALLFAFLSWQFYADHRAHVGDWGLAADMCPWEIGYCDHVGDMAVKSAYRHRGNPLAFPMAVDFLRRGGRPELAALLVRIENRMDPFKMCE